jgi:hypothetical protein
MICDEDPLRRRPRESTARRLRHERCVWMARETTKWPSTPWPITKIMPSDGCKGGTVPLAMGQWYIIPRSRMSSGECRLEPIWGISAQWGATTLPWTTGTTRNTGFCITPSGAFLLRPVMHFYSGVDSARRRGRRSIRRTCSFDVD